MRKLAVAVLLAALSTQVASADTIQVLKKKAFSKWPIVGYVVTYKHNGKIVKGTKVHCAYRDRPMYLLENLDRGDGVRLGIDLASDSDSTKITDQVLPGYMSWAIDLWVKTCK
jgi:hypothetical protein